MLTQQQKDAVLKFFGPELGKTILSRAQKEPTPGKTVIKFKMPDLPTFTPKSPDSYFFGPAGEKAAAAWVDRQHQQRQEMAAQVNGFFGQKAKSLDEVLSKWQR